MHRLGSDGRGRGKRSGPVHDQSKPCTFFQINGHCKYGMGCRYSHVTDPSMNAQSSVPQSTRPPLTKEQIQKRNDYNAWKRRLKQYSEHNIDSISQFWDCALQIQNGDDREWQQQLARDLDNDSFNGRQHIEHTMSRIKGHATKKAFLAVSKSFLLVMTHRSFLESLTIDPFVGGLYNFMSGNNGTRVVPYLQDLCAILVDKDESYVKDNFADELLLAMCTALREILKREQRARLHDDLPLLLDPLDNILKDFTVGDPSTPLRKIKRLIEELRPVVARNSSLVTDKWVSESASPPLAPNASFYPLNIVIPQDRHDNDNMDITKIQIFPTREELMSDTPEVLPFADRDQFHYLADPIARHFDTQFRLLRYEVFGELKQSISLLMKNMDRNAVIFSKYPLGVNVRANHYTSAQIASTSFDRRVFKIEIEFDQPPNILKKSHAEQRRWWEESNRFQEGTLLSLIIVESGKAVPIFLTVHERVTHPIKEGISTQDRSPAIMTAQLIVLDQVSVTKILRWSCGGKKGILCEFPGVLPATFVPFLENLQRMAQLNHLPFHQWILPEKVTSDNTPVLKIPAPLYSQDRGFTIPLDAILRKGAPSFSLTSDSSPDDTSLVKLVSEQTGLDSGQSKALVSALTRELAFIQGPPGTGKSYVGVQIMRVLLSIKSKANLGPVVVVCYTNHALDQFLEHLLKVDIKKVIRVGGSSHSKLLQGHNIQVVSKGEPKTNNERNLLYEAYRFMKDEEEPINPTLRRLQAQGKGLHWKYFENHLARGYSQIHKQFSTMTDEGYQIAGRHRFDIWMPKSGAMHLDTNTRLEEALHLANNDVFSLSVDQKVLLVKSWMRELQEEQIDGLFEKMKQVENKQKIIHEIHQEVDRRVMQNADVIGITTNGLAKNMSLMQRLDCKVIICEEAGEVLEAHMLSTMLPSVEHVIQIGDHEQLRPSVHNYSLSVESDQGSKYKLDRSQFERLVSGEPGRSKIPVAQLDVQRRMRPEISRLIQNTIYRHLENHISTLDFPDVVGMRENLFWLEHHNFEDAHQPEHQKNWSKSNTWEVKMVHALVRHIVRQGVYSSSEIAVLTPYTGQLQKLRAAMRDDFDVVLSERDQEALERDGLDDHGGTEGEQRLSATNKRITLAKKQLSEMLRIATVDNFQGEEAKIVIISLVRSNNDKNVGFLKTTNRINVLLSRAQHGMYLIGNPDTYANVPMWQNVIQMMKSTGSIGTSLGLCCPRHKDTLMNVTEAEDFSRMSPGGGCRRSCDRRLPDCGHQCLARCHADSMHRAYVCLQQCERLHHPCNHPCQKMTCGEDCGNCKVSISNVKLPCGHTKDNVLCYLAQKPENIKCTAIVSKVVQDCLHSIKEMCHVDVTSERFRCPTPCDHVLPCGHLCTGTCGRCLTQKAGGQVSIKHQSCQKKCGRGHSTCNHTCEQNCHSGTDCGLCEASCEVRCVHSRCDRKCHEVCAPCVQTCAWSCEHQGSCTMPCAAPCNRLPCEKRCVEYLSCGHQCPGLCGEACPEGYCQSCGHKADSRVDMLEFKTYAEIDVDKTPVVVLSCGHFFTAETLDGMVGLHDVYETDQRGEISGLKDLSGELAIKIPQCPDCKCPIKQYVTQRYNRAINRAVMDEMCKRFIVHGQAVLRELALEISGLEEELNSSAVIDKFEGRYNQVRLLEKKVQKLKNEFAQKHQPAQKLHDAIARSRRNDAEIEDIMEKLTISNSNSNKNETGIDQRIITAARLLEVRIACIALEDNFTMLGIAPETMPLKFPDGSPDLIAPVILKICNQLIEDSKGSILPRYTVEATLFYYRMVSSFSLYMTKKDAESKKVSDYRQHVIKLLQDADFLCQHGSFQGAKELGQAVQDAIVIVGHDRYEEVTQDELNAIKNAMISGPGGMATHSGHWYNCANGHPFAIGECGMPMEEARCPECGAIVGGQHHVPVEGMTRATQME